MGSMVTCVTSLRDHWPQNHGHHGPAFCTNELEDAMAKTMQAAVVERFGHPLELRELPIPVPGPGQALVKVISTGVCHTALHAADGDWPVKPTLPFVPGHEGAGIAVALGSGVKHLKEGDRVGIAWLGSACGYCEY